MPAANSQATRTPAGSIAPLAADSLGVAAVRETESETIEVWVAGEPRAAQRFVDAVDTPSSPAYRRFLSPSAYSERFGPSATQVNTVRFYLTGAGFSQVHASLNGDHVAATAPVSTINRAFSMQMRRYRGRMAASRLRGSKRIPDADARCACGGLTPGSLFQEARIAP